MSTDTMETATQVYKHVYLKNEGSETYTEDVAGEKYTIEPGKQIKVTRHLAAQIKGQFPGDKVQKCLRTIPILPTEPRTTSYVCQIDGKSFETQSKLDEHLANLRAKLQGKK